MDDVPCFPAVPLVPVRLKAATKPAPRWRAMQEQQRAETARKKEYLRQADEACRAVLSQCRRCGGYVFSAGSY